jgi:phosphotransferase system HPr-like phosphotransfer protein
VSYWSADADGCDFAFNCVSVHAVALKKRMFHDAELAIENSMAEQSIVASLRCLRALDAQFGKAIRIGFRGKDLELAVKLFESWYEKAGAKVPKKHRAEMLSVAREEFRLYREQLSVAV